MTSFTQRPETCFTLPRVRSTQGGSEKDVMGLNSTLRRAGTTLLTAWTISRDVPTVQSRSEFYSTHIYWCQ